MIGAFILKRRTVIVSIAMLLVGIIVGIGLMQINPVYLSIQSALGKENTLNYIGASGTQGLDFQNYLKTGDLEALMMAVQSERVRLLDAQLIDQVKAVQARNDQIAKLNQLLSSLNSLNGTLHRDMKAEAIIHPAWFDRMQALYLNGNSEDKLPADLPHDEKGTLLTNIHNSRIVAGITYLPYKTKGELEGAISKVKSLIDAEANNQQMDMLRLQSLNNKKNESIEILTNAQKKHTDASSNIIRNMR